MKRVQTRPKLDRGSSLIKIREADISLDANSDAAVGWWPVVSSLPVYHVKNECTSEGR